MIRALHGGEAQPDVTGWHKNFSIASPTAVASVDVCICTHNPRAPLLRLVLAALARQTAHPDSYRVFLVDNASDPPIQDGVLEPLTRRGVCSSILRVPELGVTKARLRAIEATKAPWILFLDDDNVPDVDYIEHGLLFLSGHSEVGCFGGKLLLPPELNPARWCVPFLDYMAIKDLGETILSGVTHSWRNFEPPTAGAFVSRAVLNKFREILAKNADGFLLGRVGLRSLNSCEDGLMMHCAGKLGLALAYYPRLKLWHHLDPARFQLRYLLRLMTAYGSSHVLLESLIKERVTLPTYYSTSEIFRTMLHTICKDWQRSAAFAFAKVAYHLSARREFRRRVRI
jgi:glycosyltransferase involved in cell wall biosynthesis